MDEDKIDRCFVNEDADGIYEILDKTEANADLSGWNKLRIINEGRSVLFDLRMERIIDQDEWMALSPEERRLKLYQKQKAFSEAIRERGAVSREQFEKRLRELAGKMEEQ